MNEQKIPRFMNVGAKVVYDLFDAFIKATLVDDKAIDFSKPVTTKEDGTLEFATRDEKFSDIISGNFKVQVVKAPHKPSKPHEPKEPKEPKPPRKPEEFKNDAAKAKYEEEVRKYQKRLESFPERMKKYEAARAAYSPQKLETLQEEYQILLERYNAQTAVADEKRAALLKDKGLLYSHVNWLWTLGMTNSKTTCGADKLDASSTFAEEGLAFTGKLGLWKAGLGSMQKEQSFLCNVLFRYATLDSRIKFATVEDVKRYLVSLAWKVKASEKNNARHGLLHLCDPDNYIGLYSVEAKIQWINEKRVSRKDFVDSYNKCDLDNSVCYKDEKLGYRYPTTDALICYLEDMTKQAKTQK